MTAYRLVVGALGAAIVAIVLVLVLSGGGSPYVMRLHLADADGLRSGSPVVIGGLNAGTVKLHLSHDRSYVIADLDLERKYGPVGRDATASIGSLNLLGQKRVEVTPGDRADAAPSGFVFPASRVTTSTDLDQVLDVLTPDTRTRLAVLINEAGSAFAGREADWSQVLQQMPHAFSSSTALLGQLVSDNHTLAHLVQTSNGWLGQFASQHAALGHMVDVVGQASTSFADQRAALRQTLADAPGTLHTMQAFLAKLQATTVPLGPAARDITATAPQLSATLAQVDPFRVAADPALNAATRVAPDLTTLAAKATPVLNRTVPVAHDLAAFSTSFVPVSNTLDHSIDNLLAIMQNWSRAIQFRDGLSHVFRGEASFTPDAITTFVDRLLALNAKSSKHSSPSGRAKPKLNLKLPVTAPKPAASNPVAPLTQKLQQTTNRVQQGVQSLLNYLVKP